MKRVCKCGAGVEVTAGKGNTPGFPLKEEPQIINDLRGFKRLDMKRNNKWMVQTSLFLAQGWHANSDVQILIYDTSPINVDSANVAKVVNYIVAYACKGNESEVQEKQNLKSLILEMRKIILMM